MIKAAFISAIHRMPYAGCEELWVRTAAHLSRAGGRVEANVCYQPWPEQQMAMLESSGCTVHRRRRRTAISRGPRILWQRFGLKRPRPLDTFPGYRAARRWLAEMRPDLVVISQDFQTHGMPWVQACHEAQAPYALVIQSAGECEWPEDHERDILVNAYQGAQRAFFVSRKNRDLVATQLGITLRNAEVVRNPFNVSYQAAPPWPQQHDGIWRLACPARLHPRSKGQDLLFQVLRADSWRNRPILVTLYGKGPNEQNLRALAAAYELAKVTFAGFTNNVEAVWQENHALILPSRYEGLPLAVVEAMLCARPCIVTDAGGNAEIVEDESTGFVASAPALPQLRDAMERAWHRREEWRAMGERAAARIRQLLPADPAAEFANRLLEIAGGRDRR